MHNRSSFVFLSLAVAFFLLASCKEPDPIIEEYTHQMYAEAGKPSSLVIPDGIIKIAPGAFNGCTGLTGIIILGNMTSIEDYTFSGCSGLTCCLSQQG
jgi:hypothetical protein